MSASERKATFGFSRKVVTVPSGLSYAPAENQALHYQSSQFSNSFSSPVPQMAREDRLEAPSPPSTASGRKNRYFYDALLLKSILSLVQVFNHLLKCLTDPCRNGQSISSDGVC